MTDRLPVIVAVENEPVARKEIEVQLRRRRSSDHQVVFAERRRLLRDAQDRRVRAPPVAVVRLRE